MGRTQASTSLIAQCRSQSCRFRFPVIGHESPVEQCPLCGWEVELETHSPHRQAEFANLTSADLRVEALLDNIRSVYNVGSIFRTADGAGVRHLHLAGITTTPDHRKAAKTALGAEIVVPWTYHRNGVEAAARLKGRGVQLWAVEGAAKATSLFDSTCPPSGSKILLVVGNELVGVDPGILELCDKVVQIPMQGIKRSLNVAVAFGIAAYYLCSGQHRHVARMGLHENSGMRTHEKSQE